MIGEDYAESMEDGVEYFDLKTPQQQRGLRRSLGVPFGWIGEIPTINITPTTPCSSPTTHFLAPNPINVLITQTIPHWWKSWK